MQELGFNPTRVDKGNPISVIIGSMGEVLKVDHEGRAVGKVSIPFPTQPSFGAVSSGRWVGAWVERSLKKACMGAMSLDLESGDGRGRDFLRAGNRSASEVLPDSCLWTRDIEGEPMGVSSNNGKVTFGVLNTGIYMVNDDASEIWRTPYPQWPELQEFSSVDSVVDIIHTPEGIAIWSESGGISLVSEHDGSTLMSRALRLPERIIGVRHDGGSGWMILMSGRYAGMMKSLDSDIEILKLPGPMMDSISTGGGNWIWTGWRHDGKVNNGTIEIRERSDIGISILGERVLTNSGRWSNHSFSE